MSKTVSMRQRIKTAIEAEFKKKYGNDYNYMFIDHLLTSGRRSIYVHGRDQNGYKSLHAYRDEINLVVSTLKTLGFKKITLNECATDIINSLDSVNVYMYSGTPAVIVQEYELIPVI